MDFLHYCEGAGTSDYGRIPLDRPVAAVRHSALEVLRLYLSGEVDFEPTGSRPPHPDDPCAGSVLDPVPSPR